jgi:hypothetical protein
MAVDVERLRAERVYESRAPLGTLAGDLLQIEALAAGWRAGRKRLFLAGAGTLLAGGLFLFLFFPAGIVLIAIALFLFSRAKAQPKAVANHPERCAFAKSLAGMLELDTDSKTPAGFRLAFAPKEEVLSEKALPHRKNGKEQLCKSTWFSVETTFLDGTDFTETIDDLVRRRSFKNPRGKSKTKTRTRSLIAMRFSYPADVYGDLTPLGAKMQKEIRLPQSASVRGLEVNDRAVKVKALVTNSDDLAQTSSMLALGVYRMLNLSRKLAARKRAQAKRGGAQ